MISAPTRQDGEPAGARRRERDRWLGRRHLERRLHDGASLRLSALVLRLGLLDPAAEGDEPGWRARIAELQHELHLVLQELREVSEHIYPQLLDQAGLAPALRELADGAAGGLELEVSADAARQRFGPVAEGAAYFAVAECLARRPPERARVLQVTLADEHGGVVLTARGVDAEYLDRVLDQVQPLGGTAEAVEPQAIGTQALETQALGTQALGTQALGTQALGTQALGIQAIGTQAIGTQAIGAGAVGAEARPRTVVLWIPRDEDQSEPTAKEHHTEHEPGRSGPSAEASSRMPRDG